MRLAVDIEVRKTGNGFELVNAGLRELGPNAKKAAGDAGAGIAGLQGQLGKLAAQIGIAAAAWKAFDVLKGLVTQGLQFNAQMEQSRLSLAALIGAFGEVKDASGNAMNDFNTRLVIAEQLQQKLKIAALQTTAEYTDMAEALQHGLGPALKAGFNTDQVVEFTKMVTQAAGAIGLPMNQLGQEIRSLFSGDIGIDSRLANLLFTDIPRDKIKKYVEELQRTGHFFDEMKKRMGAFAEAGERAGDTMTGALSNLKDAFAQALGEGTQDAFSTVTQLVKDLTAQIVTFDENNKAVFNQDFIDGLSAIARAFVGIAEAVVGTIEKLGMFADYLGALKDYATAQDTRPPATTIEEVNRRRDQPEQTLDDFIALRVRARQSRQQARAARTDPAALLRELAESGSSVGASQLMQEMQRRGLQLGGRTDKTGDPDAKKHADAAMRAAEAERQRKSAVDASMHSLQDLYDTIDRGILGTKEEEAAIAAEVNILRIKNELETLISSATGDRLGVMQKQLTLQERLNSAQVNRARAEATQRDTAEAARYLDVLEKIEARQRHKEEEQRQYKTTKGRQGMSPAEAAKEEELIAAAIDQARREHEGVVKLNEQRLQKDITEIDLQALRERDQLNRQIWAEQHKYLLGLYEDLNQAIVGGAHDTVMALFSGGDLQDAFDGLLSGIQRSWANTVSAMADEWMKKLMAQASGVPLLDAQGKPMNAVPGGRRGAQGTYLGIQSAAALYGLYQAGQNGAGQRENMLSGAAQGAAIGISSGNPYAAIVGAVVGAVFGAITGKAKAGFTIESKNGKITIKGSGSASEADVQEALQHVNLIIANTRQSMLDLIDAFPAEIAKSLLDSFGDVKNSDTFGNFIAGKQEWKSWFAKQVGSINKRITSLSGEDLKQFIENTLPKLMFDAYAPIIESGMKDLGVTEAKIKELLNQGPGFDATEALKKLRGFVEVLVGMVDSETFNKLSGADLITKATEKIGETPIAAIRRIGDEMKDLAVGFEDLTTDEQVKRGQTILGLEKTRQEAVLQYLYQIKQAQDSLFTSIDAQLREIGLQGKGGFGQRSELLARIEEVAGKIVTAATPQELQALGSEYQQLVGRVFELTTRLPAEIKDLIEGFKGLDDILSPEKSPLARLGDLQTKIAEASKKLAEATNPDDQITAARELLGLTQQKYELERQMLAEIKTTLESITQSIGKQIADFQLEARVTEAERRGASPAAIANIRIEDALKTQRELRDRLNSATSASEINDIVSQMQQNANLLFNLMGKTPEAAAQLVTMLEDVRRIAQEKLKALADAIAADDAANKKRVDDAITILTEALGKLPVAADEATAALNALRELLATRFAELTEQVVAANTDLLETIGEILERLRSGLEGIFGTTGGGTTGGTTGGGGGRGSNPPNEDDPWNTNTNASRYSAPQTTTSDDGQIIVQLGAPIVNVTVSGTAEKVIDDIVATAEIRGAQMAIRAIASQQGRRSSL